MKRCVIACCIFVALSTVGLAQSPAAMDLYGQLLTSSDRVEALETVLKTPDEYSAVILFLGAGVAFGGERLEDSAFLFYAGQLRMRFDQKCFPSKGTGSEDPLLPLLAISQGLGIGINPAIMAEPKAYKRAIDRLKKWTPKAPEEYTPGYEFNERLSETDAHEAAKPNRTEFLSRMDDLATLLNDAEYFAAYRVIRKYNTDRDDKVPAKKEEYEKATETMKRIEKDKSLKGFFSVE